MEYRSLKIISGKKTSKLFKVNERTNFPVLFRIKKNYFAFYKNSMKRNIKQAVKKVSKLDNIKSRTGS